MAPACTRLCPSSHMTGRALLGVRVSLPEGLFLKAPSLCWAEWRMEAPMEQGLGPFSSPAGGCHGLQTFSSFPSSCQAVTPTERAWVLSWGSFSYPALPVVAKVPCHHLRQRQPRCTPRGPHTSRGQGALPSVPPGYPPLRINETLPGSWRHQAIWGAASIFILDLGMGGPAQAEMPFKGSFALALQPASP